MIITINQAEIETAIRQYIESQIVIREGMEISVDLRPTRGEAGFTANIDILPANAPKAATPSPKAAEPAAKAEPAPAAKVEPKADPAPAAVPEDKPEVATAEAEVAPEPTPAVAPKSLFANLKKPVNS